MMCRSRFDQEIIEPLASSDLRLEPKRALAAPGPNLRRVARISILWGNARVRAAAGHIVGCLQLVEALLEFGLFRFQLLADHECYTFVERPQLIDGHRF